MTDETINAARNLSKAFHIALHYTDSYTAAHSKQVGDLSYEVSIGTMLGLSPEECEGLRLAGYLHDVGKLAIPTELLVKTAPLLPEEFNLVKSHTIRGYEILSVVDWPWPVAEAALQHHERLDGSGYPHGLVGSDICTFSRIIAVTDVIDAITANRPYRVSRGWDAAKAELLSGRGIKYDVDVVDAAVHLMTKPFVSHDTL